MNTLPPAFSTKYFSISLRRDGGTKAFYEYKNILALAPELETIIRSLKETHSAQDGWELKRIEQWTFDEFLDLRP